jgi:hypothetical protein
MDPKLVQQVIDALVAGDGAAALKLLEALLTQAAGGEVSSSDGAATDPTATSADGAAAAKKDPAVAAMSLIGTLVGKASEGEIVAAVRTLAQSHQSSADAQAALDRTSRIELVGQLVKLGVEYPSTAWAGKPEDHVPAAHLSAEPLDGLRARVAKLSALRAPEGNAHPEATTELSADEQAAADKIKDPGHKERFIAARLSRHAARRAS